jgi:tetratricopeptide (TPR) repeat protein
VIIECYVCFLAVPWLFQAAPGHETTAPSCDLARSMALVQSGHSAFERRDFQVAAQQLRAALDACPGRQRGIVPEMAQALAYINHSQQALEILQELLGSDPSSIPGRLALANVYLIAQRLGEAKREVESVLAIDPSQPAALKMKANLAYLAGNFEEARDTLIKVLERFPNDEDGSYMLGRIYYQESRIDHAMGQFERVLKINPRSYKAYDNLGLCYQARGETDKAIHSFLASIKLVEKDHPEYDWPYANLANLLLDNGDAGKAFAFASRAANRNPNSARSFYIGGKALCQLNKTDLCVNWLQRSAALDPSYPEPLYLLARTYHRLGQEQKAEEAREKFSALKAKQPTQRR